MKKYLLAVDQGTTSSRAIVFDRGSHIIAMAQKEIPCLFPNPGWVEADALTIWISVNEVINEVIIKANIKITDIDSIGITNQRETTIVWDKNTGMPVYNAIIWQSKQTSDICNSLSKYKDVIKNKTGLLIDPYFSASKIRFILDHIENGQARAENGELCFGTVDSWLLYKLTDGQVHATDVTNASRTMLFNIHDMEWDKQLCSIFNVPMCMLPKVQPTSYNYGETQVFSSKIKIGSLVGDQQAALFGQTCFEVGDVKNTYGTGCFMLVNTGDHIVKSKNGLLSTVAWKINDEVTYALEGSVFIGGAVIQWLRDELELVKSASDSEELANQSKVDKGLYFVPAFVGLGTPYWDDEARGAMFGLTRATNKADFAKAALESIAYQCKDVFETMEKDTGEVIHSLKVDGGATHNKYLVQFQSDILGIDIDLPNCLETTALGAAYLAGLSTGYYSSLEEIKSVHSIQKTYNPHMDIKDVKERYEGWKVAVKATRAFKLK